MATKKDTKKKETSRWMSLKETTEYMRLSKETLYRLIYKNSIPRYRVGKLYLFDRAEIDGYIQERKEGIKKRR